MNRKIKRIIALLLSLTLMLPGLPVFAEEATVEVTAPEDIPVTAQEEVVPSLADIDPVAAASETDAPAVTAAPTVIPSETDVPTQQPTEVPVSMPPETMEPSLPETETTPDSGISGNGVQPSASAPAAEPTVLPEPEENGSASVLPTDEPESTLCPEASADATPENTAEAPQPAETAIAALTTIIPLSVLIEETPEPIPEISASPSPEPTEEVLLSTLTDFVIEGDKLLAYQGPGGLAAIPDGIATICAEAFKDCTALTAVEIPGTLKSIEARAFSGCTGLTELILPEGLTSIGEAVFEGCSALRLIRIPGSVTAISELGSLIEVTPNVQIEVFSGSYAELFCIENGIAFVCFEENKQETIIPEAIILPAESITIGLKEKVSVSNWILYPDGAQDTMTYASASPKVASVSEDGIITGKRAGSTTITLTSGTGLTAVVKVTVKREPSSVKITTDRTVLGVGEILQLGYTLSSGSAGSVSFESLNQEIASVTESGCVAALTPGVVQVKAKTYNGRTKTAELTVAAAPETITPAQTEVKIGAQDSWVLGYALNEGSAGAVYFASSNEAVATVGTDGRINALTEGETEITLTTYNGRSASCKVTVVPAPVGIELTAERTEIGVGEKLQLKPVISPEGTMGTISYKSSRTSTASVDKSGILSAKRAGTVTITATTYNGLSATLKIVIKRAPSSVGVDLSRKVLGVGETAQLGYKLSSGSAGSVSFESLKPEIASITADGSITALTPGVVQIKAKTYNGRTKTAELTVAAAPETITPAQTEVKIGAQDSWVLGYALNEGSAGAVYFSSSNETVATVGADDRINALTEGETEITLTTYNGKSASCKVTVVPAPVGIELTAERTEIGVGEKLQLKPVISPEGTMGTITYKSSRTSTASVDKSGIVSAKRAGTVTITATTYNGLTATLKIVIKRAPSSVGVALSRKVLGVGETAQLGYKLSSGSAGSVSFESLNPEIASITADGSIIALNPGVAQVKAKTYNGKTKTAELMVAAAPETITPAKTEVKIGAQDSWVLGYALNEGSSGAVYFASSNEAVATVGGDGRINALTEGETEITLTTYNGKSASCKVTVVPAPVGIELTADRTEIGVGEKLQLKPVISPEGTMGTITYKSSRTSTATVDKSGVVTAKRAGTVTITATTYNGLTATLKIVIKRAPSSVGVALSRKVLGVGETAQLGYTLSSGSAGSVSFESLKPEIASITADGSITALTPGVVQVKAKTYNGRTKTAELTIMQAPSEVIPAATEVRIGKDDAWKLQASVNEGAAGSLSFASTDESIACVDNTGLISAIAEGEASIIVTAYNEVSASCKVHVVPAPDAISLGTETATIGLNEKLQLNATISPEGTVGTLKYKSSSTKVATVNSDGLVSAKRAGTAVITVSTYNDKTAQIKITVKKDPSSVTIKADRKRLGVGEVYQIGYTLSKGSAGAVYFESLNPEIISVSRDGEMTAHACGNATIRAVAYNGRKSTAEFEVLHAPQTVTLNACERSIGMGDRWTIGYNLDAGTAGAVAFSSNNPGVASVDASGRITAHQLGNAEITAAAYNGVSAKCTIKVVPAPQQIDVSMLRNTLGLKEQYKLTPKLLPEGSAGKLSYKSSKTSVISVSGDGILTAKKAGTATITITAYNGTTANLKVKVDKAASGIKISAERNRYGVGEEMRFTAAVSGTGAGGYTFESSNPNIIAVNAENGRAKAIAPGQAAITAKTFNGKTDSVVIDITAAPAGIDIGPSDIAIGAGDTARLTAKLWNGAAGTYSFSSADESIASVDVDSGKITANAVGCVQITATAYNGVSNSVQVQVLDPVRDLELKGLHKNEAGIYELNLIRGEKLALEPVLGKYSSIGCSYSVTNRAVSVGDDGVLTAQRGGACVVNVVAYSGAKAVVHVTVKRMLDMYPDVRAIMHAMGSIDGKRYSNSRDAFLSNYAKGNRLFEIDLQYTKDGELVLWHSWSSNRINSKVSSGYIPATEAEFASMLVFDKYDSLTYRDLLRLMDEYPDVRFFIDNKKTSAADVRKQFNKMVSVAREMGLEHTLDRMVIMIYSKEMFEITSSIYPFSNYVLMGYKYFSDAPSASTVEKAMQYCVENGIEMISMWDYWWQPKFMDLANKYGLDVNLHTVNSADKARELVLQGVKLISTDDLYVSIL